jgi:hypothetical protein
MFGVRLKENSFNIMSHSLSLSLSFSCISINRRYLLTHEFKREIVFKSEKEREGTQIDKSSQSEKERKEKRGKEKTEGNRRKV